MKVFFRVFFVCGHHEETKQDENKKEVKQENRGGKGEEKRQKSESRLLPTGYKICEQKFPIIK